MERINLQLMPAASQPISLTSMKVLCCSFVMRVPMGDSSKMLLKSAAVENMELMPSCRRDPLEETPHITPYISRYIHRLLTFFSVGFRSVSNSNLNLGK